MNNVLIPIMHHSVATIIDPRPYTPGDESGSEGEVFPVVVTMAVVKVIDQPWDRRVIPPRPGGPWARQLK